MRHSIDLILILFLSDIFPSILWQRVNHLRGRQWIESSRVIRESRSPPLPSSLSLFSSVFFVSFVVRVNWLIVVLLFILFKQRVEISSVLSPFPFIFFPFRPMSQPLFLLSIKQLEFSSRLSLILHRLHSMNSELSIRMIRFDGWRERINHDALPVVIGEEFHAQFLVHRIILSRKSHFPRQRYDVRIGRYSELTMNIHFSCMAGYTAYFDFNDIQTFFSDSPNPSNAEQAKEWEKEFEWTRINVKFRMINGFLKDNSKIFHETIRRINPTEDEFLALLGLIFWNIGKEIYHWSEMNEFIQTALQQVNLWLRWQEEIERLYCMNCIFYTKKRRDWLNMQEDWEICSSLWWHIRYSLSFILIWSLISSRLASLECPRDLSISVYSI